MEHIFLEVIDVLVESFEYLGSQKAKEKGKKRSLEKCEIRVGGKQIYKEKPHSRFVG